MTDITTWGQIQGRTITVPMEVDRFDAATFAMASEGRPVLSVTFPTGPADGMPSRVETGSYSYVDGVPHETPLAMDLGTAMIDPDDVVIDLGEGPVADELRTLGLPKAPDFGTWGTDLTATFQLGHPI